MQIFCKKTARLSKAGPKEDYLSLSFVNSTIAFTTVATPITIVIVGPGKAAHKIKIAIPNPNQFKNKFFIL